MEGAVAGDTAQFTQGDAAPGLIFEITANACDHVVGGGAVAVGMAAVAGAEPRLLRLLRRAEEGDLLATRAAGGTGGAAIDAGRTHGINELLVKMWIALQHGGPASVTFEIGCGCHARTLRRRQTSCYPKIAVKTGR